MEIPAHDEALESCQLPIRVLRALSSSLGWGREGMGGWGGGGEGGRMGKGLMPPELKNVPP